MGVAPGLKLEFKGSDQMKGDLSLVYRLPTATLTAEANVIDFSSCKASALTTVGDFKLGGAIDLGLAGKAPELSAYTLGASYSLPKLFFGLRASNKLSDFSGLVHYNHCPTLSVVSAVKYSGKKATTDVTLGALYYCHPLVALKLKATSEGVLSCSAKKVEGKAFSVVGAAEVNVKDLKDVKFGVTASLG